MVPTWTSSLLFVILLLGSYSSLALQSLIAFPKLQRQQQQLIAVSQLRMAPPSSPSSPSSSSSSSDLIEGTKNENEKKEKIVDTETEADGAAEATTSPLSSSADVESVAVEVEAMEDVDIKEDQEGDPAETDDEESEVNLDSEKAGKVEEDLGDVEALVEAEIEPKTGTDTKEEKSDKIEAKVESNEEVEAGVDKEAGAEEKVDLAAAEEEEEETDSDLEAEVEVDIEAKQGTEEVVVEEEKSNEQTNLDANKITVSEAKIEVGVEQEQGEDQEKENSFQNFLLSRRTINNFELELPDNWEKSLERAIEAATFAPNHKRTEPWRFHLLGPKSIRNVCELNAEIVAAAKGKDAAKKKLDRWLAMPGWLVVTCVKATMNSITDDDDGSNNDDNKYKDNDDHNNHDNLYYSMDQPDGLAREDYAACCCAVQNLCLSLHADGIGTKWTTGPVNFDPRFATAVGLPSNEYVVGTIWFGTPESIPKPPVKKLSMSDIFVKHD